jgi:hypothetical protein
MAAVLMFSTVCSSTALGQTRSQGDVANAPAVIDVMLLRPAGFISLVIGTVLFVGLAPIVLVTRPHEIGTQFKQLIVRPAKYIWVDPLGGH